MRGKGVSEAIYENVLETIKYHANKTFYLLLLYYNLALHTKCVQLLKLGKDKAEIKNRV